MAVVESGTSIEWLAPIVEKMGGVNELVGRICPSWRMVPGVIALASCIAGIVCAFIWHSEMLSIAFAPGAVGSIYMIYLGWAFHNLKTFAQNNEEFKVSLKELDEENNKLKEHLATLEQEIKGITEAKSGLQSVLKEFQEEKITLEEANKKLLENVQKLEGINETLSIKAGNHVRQLHDLQNSLIGIEQAAKEDHTQFSKHLLTFIEQVKLLEATRTGLETTGSTLETKMQEQIQVLLGAAKMLEAIFVKIEEWKDNEGIQKRIKCQQLLQASTDDLSKKIFDFKTQLARGEGQLEEQAKQLQDLKKIKEGFGIALNNLLKQVANLADVKEELAKEVLNAAQVFRNYQLHVTTN